MSRRAIVTELAPDAPPCFSSQRVWVEFLVAAVDATKSGRDRIDSRIWRVSPLDARHNPPTFNWHFDFCAGCLAKHALTMDAQGRCQPGFLLAGRESAGTAVPGVSVGAQTVDRQCEATQSGAVV